MIHWNKLLPDAQMERIRAALAENVNFASDHSLGYPASMLDTRTFPDTVSFLDHSPVLQAFVANPNHIGCHTFGDSETAFKGTQKMEKEVLAVIAESIFRAEPDSYDGYIASGGTESNIQAIWMYRNYFMNQCGASPEQIVIVASEDTHYSIAKASNLLLIDRISVPVNEETREIDESALGTLISNAKKSGKKYAIAVANMGTTMFGSTDNPEVYCHAFEQAGFEYKLHIDAAYGGFYYPFSHSGNAINFSNPKISSMTIDAHKVLQAPYGTGVFLCRKGFIENVLTQEAGYVAGFDLTLVGSRSGANAVAVWSILFSYGAHEWFERIAVLQMRTDWLCKQLDRLNFAYFRDAAMNVVTLRARPELERLAGEFTLVPQEHSTDTKWYKIVVMGHVSLAHLERFVNALESESALV